MWNGWVDTRAVGTRQVTALAAFACLLVLVPGASAATLAPNASFESNCSGTPCNWESLGGTFTWDSSTANTGSASAKLVGPGTASAIRSACIAVTTSGMYTNRFFYKTAAAAGGPQSVAWELYYYADAGCTTFQFGNGPSFVPVIADAQWHQTPLQGLPVDTSTTHGVQVGVAFQCSPPPCTDPTTRTLWFDDVDFDAPGATAVSVSDFTARAGGGRVVLRWRTGAEAGLAGFNVYRGNTRLNRSLLLAAGRAYAFVDRSPPAGRTVRYRLQVVHLDGTVAWSAAVYARH
jgi:hypothetical protein